MLQDNQAYRIVDWMKHFEKTDTKKCHSMSWVAFPAKYGDGYCVLMEHDETGALYGAWCATVILASKCIPRGTLLRNPTTPHTPHTISRRIRIFPETIVKMLDVCLNECGWLEVIDLTHPLKIQEISGKVLTTIQNKTEQEKEKTTPAGGTQGVSDEDYMDGEAVRSLAKPWDVGGE